MRLSLVLAVSAALVATTCAAGAGILNPSTPGSGLASSLFGERFIGLGPPYFGQQPTTLVIKLAQDFKATFPSTLSPADLAAKKAALTNDLINIVAGYMEINTARISLDSSMAQPYVDQYDPRTTYSLKVDFPFPGWGALVWTRTFTNAAQWLRGFQAMQGQFASYWSIGYAQCTGPFSVFASGNLCNFVTIKTPAAPPPPPPPVFAAVDVLFTAFFDIDPVTFLGNTAAVIAAIQAGFARAFADIPEIKRVDVDNVFLGPQPVVPSRKLLQQPEVLLADITLVSNLQDLLDQGLTQQEAIDSLMARVKEVLDRLVADSVFAAGIFEELGALGGRFLGFINLRFGPFRLENTPAPPPRPALPDAPNSPEQSPPAEEELSPPPEFFDAPPPDELP